MDHPKSNNKAPVILKSEESGNYTTSDRSQTVCNSASSEVSKHPPKPDPTTKSTSLNVCTGLKYAYSTALLIFSTAIVCALIFQKDTKLSQDLHPVFVLVLILLFLVWLSMVEGGQAALVGLGPISHGLYKTSHPITFKCMELGHKGDNLDRYLIGRQFLVVLIVFVINLCGAPNENVSVFDISGIFQDVFVRSSLALILLTAMAGQLHPQINATRCMLDYINTNFMLFTLYVSLALEACGAMHSVYLLQKIFAKLSGTPIQSSEPPRTSQQSILFWGRVLFSLILLGFSFAVTLSALFHKKTNMWDGVPAGISVVLFFLLMFILGILEGTQIAVFSVSRCSIEERAKHPAPVKKALELLLRDDGCNIPRFMVGRQIIVTVLVFVIARITTVNVDIEAGEETLFGTSKGAQKFYNTGLLGAIIVTTLGCISWRLIGSAFPVLFLSNPLVYLLIRISLVLEASGICSGAWVLASLHKWMAGLQLDNTYVGPAQKTATPFANDCEGQQHGDSATCGHPDDEDNDKEYGRGKESIPDDLCLPQAIPVEDHLSDMDDEEASGITASNTANNSKHGEIHETDRITASNTANNSKHEVIHDQNATKN